MHNALTALTDELRRLKASGVKSVVVADETVEVLRRTLARRAATRGPEPVKSAVDFPAAPSTEVPVDSPAVRERETTEVESKPEPIVATIPLPTPFALAAGDKATQMDSLRERVLTDPVCCVHVRPGKKIVLGVGSLDAQIMFVGEAPGAEEEVQGEPFVGPAGQLLTRMILAMGLRREDVYIGNIMNWRPEMPLNASGIQYGNRAPNEDEMRYCLPYLQAQIEIVKPAVLVALGATAAHGLLGPGAFKALGEVRGRWHEFAGKPLMITYHPSYILRNQSNRSKRMIWEDLLKVMEHSSLPISDKQRGYFLDK